MEAPEAEFENAYTWAGVGVASFWMQQATVSQPAEDGSIYKGQTSRPKGRLFMLKTFSHQLYFTYESTKSLLELKYKRFRESKWDELWEIKTIQS